MTQSLQLFEYSGQGVRTTTLPDGKPAIVLSDIAKILGYRDSTNASRILRDHHKGYSEVSTPGGTQKMLVVTEQGFNRLVIRSNAANAESVQDWVTDEVLPEISRTGSYGQTMDLTSLDGISNILDAGKAALDRAVKAEQRADVAEDRIDTIEGGNGISVREFHKHYFSETPEREFNELLYRKGLLLDQRGQRVDDNGKSKPGKQHRHPSAKGKQFFELDPHIDKYTGARYYNVKVRPGKPETDLVDQLERWGLGSNKNRRRNMLQLESHHGMRAVS